MSDETRNILGGPPEEAHRSYGHSRGVGPQNGPFARQMRGSCTTWLEIVILVMGFEDLKIL